MTNQATLNKLVTELKSIISAAKNDQFDVVFDKYQTDFPDQIANYFSQKENLAQAGSYEQIEQIKEDLNTLIELIADYKRGLLEKMSDNNNRLKAHQSYISHKHYEMSEK